jgi:heme/copper-type cytochrome/quinol oxidase subunit 3
MRPGRAVVDAAALPDHAFGHGGLIWWGTVGFMVIEGSMFLIAIVTYFYLRLQSAEWPPSLPNPDLGPGTFNLLLAAAACLPAALAKKAAEKFNLGRVRLWLTVLTVMTVANVVVRGFEYSALNCRWDDNAYGSITWLVLSLHTLHIGTDAVDSGVLAVLSFTGPMTRSRFVDVSENSLYWYFVTASWIPIYLTVYWAPRWL